MMQHMQTLLGLRQGAGVLPVPRASPGPGAQFCIPWLAHMVQGSPTAAEGVTAPGHRLFQGG